MALFLALSLSYAMIFVLKQPVAFSYANESCVGRLTLLPNLHTSSSDEDFTVTLRGGLAGVYATEACVKPVDAPEPGSRYAMTAPFGGWMFRQQYAVEVPKHPVANVTALKKPLSTTRTLTLPLSEPDTTFDYKLSIADKQTTCKVTKQVISCDVASLKLAQGAKYQTSLVRTFAETQTKLTQQTIETLHAVTPKQSSVQAGQVVNDKPREFTVEMDKPLARVEAELIRIQGDNREKVGIKVAHESQTIRVTTEADLPRDAQFELQVTKAEAIDGSSLEGLYTLPFRMSGGPNATSVSATGSSVPLGTTAVISFDQGISQTQDIRKIVQVTGAQVQITRTANQLHIKLVQVAKCADVSIVIDKGFLSNYDVASVALWKHTFRTTCYTTSTIGYSARGKAIQAYHFGNGGEAILFVGGIHGNEQSSSLILQDLVKDLNGKARTIPAQRQVVVVPTLNPDGYAANNRNNASNVNLNRNFATSDWVQDLDDTNGAVKGGGGSAPMSEPETKAIAALSQQLRPRFVLSYHAVGSVVIGNTANDAGARAAQYAAAVGYRNGTGKDAEIFDYAITGTYDDWLAQRLGVPSMIVELGSYSFRDYNHHKQAMWSVITN